MIPIPSEYILVSELTETQKLAMQNAERFFLNKELFGEIKQRGFWECILRSDLS